MKYLSGLSSFVVISLLSATPSFALSQSSNNLPSNTEAIEIAGIGDLFNDVKEVIEDATNGNVGGAIEKGIETIEQEQRRQELEAARREASERERLEAEQRRKYFESLSPEEQKAYLAEQEAKKAEADAAATLLLLEMLAIGASMDSGDSASTDSNCTGYCDQQMQRYFTDSAANSPISVRWARTNRFLMLILLLNLPTLLAVDCLNS